MSKALGLLSGGLDSTLAAELLRRQGVEVTCISFVTPFFGAGRAQKAAADLGFPLVIQVISEPHLELVKNPRYGYGRNMNPCIDCHAMMFRRAGRLMEAEGFDFIFSGEVLGQRPMSQNLSAMQAVAKHSGYAKKILRPLSARVMAITEMETAGLVDREQLLDIQGRTRRRQQEYAAAWGITDYPSSGGGCLLTEPRFSDRLRDLFTHEPDADVRCVEQLKVGRHFRLSPRSRLILGRDQLDNARVEAHTGPDDYRLKAQVVAGPCALVVGQPDETDLNLACAIVAAYGRGQHLPEVTIEISRHGEVSQRTVTPIDRARVAGMNI